MGIQTKGGSVRGEVTRVSRCTGTVSCIQR